MRLALKLAWWIPKGLWEIRQALSRVYPECFACRQLAWVPIGNHPKGVTMRTQAIAMVVAAPLLALGIPQAAAYTTPYYDGGIARPILAGTAVRRPAAARAVVRRNYGYRGRAVVPRVGSGARIGRTGPGNRGLGR